MNAPLATLTCTVALVGNPNAGKTSLFNALTGLRQKVANYPGVTIERKLGAASFGGRAFTIIDLPGTYSIHPVSPDERVAVRVLEGQMSGTPRPDVVVAVVDATSVARGLLLVTQLIDQGLPVVVALTMADLAASRGLSVDHAAISTALGVPVVPVAVPTRSGIPALLAALADSAEVATRETESTTASPARAWTAASDAADPDLADAQARYAFIDGVLATAVTGRDVRAADRPSTAIDRVLLHPVLGLLAFVLIMAGLFTTLFTLASPLMDACEAGIGWLGAMVAGWLPAGDLRDLVEVGIFGGVGAVVVFVPQIALLFLFLALLEDSGYLARAAFLMDKLLATVGLHGRSFVPMLSGHACAIPGILATRTMSDTRDRLATMLVLPFTSCSARLPVYALVVATIGTSWAAWQKGALVTGCYVLGIIAALTAAWIGTRIRGGRSLTPFLLELPAYRCPQWRQVLRSVWQGCWAFLSRAGTIIFALAIVIWALSNWPKPDPAIAEPTQAQQVEASVAGTLGRAIDPVLQPMGLDGTSGIGIIFAFAAREVFVSTLAIVHDVEEDSLPDTLRAETTATGAPRWTFANGAALLVWFVLAMQCIATTAVIKREAGGWRWAIGQLVVMNVMAWCAAVATYQVLSRVLA